MAVKLPKQWAHWCRKNGFRPHGPKTGKDSYRWLYLKGHGHVWRVNCHAQFQCGDTYAEFDRWALCEIQELNLPQTQEQFVMDYEYLLYLKAGGAPLELENT